MLQRDLMRLILHFDVAIAGVADEARARHDVQIAVHGRDTTIQRCSLS